jgi:L-asparaginase II
VADRYAGGVPLVDVVRSGFVESRHHGSVVLLGPDGDTIWSAGEVTGPVFPRSSNKPMQLVGMLRAGLPGSATADPADLAIMAASHAGEPMHTGRIRALLHRGGLDEERDLRCPPDLPRHEPTRNAVLRSGGGPARIFMNCSGKHTGMLLTCRAAGWPTDGYRAADHPLQLALRDAVADLAGEPVTAVGVDGCGAPVLAISLSALARAYLRLVDAPPGSTHRGVADAMRAHPLLVSGTGSTEAALMQGVPGLLVKGGAEGVFALAVPGAGAVALKIDDGAARATVPVAVHALRRLGVDAPVLAELVEPAVDGGGERVGVVRWSGPT